MKADADMFCHTYDLMLLKNGALAPAFTLSLKFDAAISPQPLDKSYV